MVDLFDRVYSFQSSNKFLAKIRFFSGLRMITKITANFLVPIYYLITRNFEHVLNKPESKSNKRVIVSLTTFPNRINRIWIVIESLLRQTYKPDLIILWLSKEQFNSIEQLPNRLLRLLENGLEIKLCDHDLKSHKKYFYAFKVFDDDVIYSSKVLETLIRLNERFPHSICCNVGYRITIRDGNILPYAEWEHLFVMSGPSYNISCIGVGGVLYPPGSLPQEVFNIDVFEKICLSADDIWLKAISLLGGITVVKSDYFSNYLPVIYLNNTTLSSSNVTLNKNDQQLKNIRSYYIQKSGIDPFFEISNLLS